MATFDFNTGKLVGDLNSNITSTPTSASSGSIQINPVTGKPYTAQEMVGGTIGNLGNILKLPEGGISEWLAPTAWAAEKDPMKAITQTYPVNTPTQGPGIPPVDMSKYAGWTDQNAINADWQKTWQQKTAQPSGGSGSGGGVARPNLSLAPAMGGTDQNANDYWNQMKAAADAGDQAARDSLNSQYDRQESQLYGQLGTAESNKNLTLTDILNSLSTTQKGIEKQKTESQQAVADETARAGQAAQSTQRTNRNVLRALGILNSTYSADALQKPMNEFDMERNRLTNIGIQNIGKLDEGLNAAKAEAETQKNKVIAQFNDIVGKINSDIRFSQAERTNALNASRAALQQRIADIQGQKFNYEQQATQLRQNFITDLAKIQASANPTQANISNIMKSIAFSSPQTANTQQAQIYNGQRNGLAQGFSMANYPGWDQAAAYEDYKKKNGI
jgi:hypothetical protein